MKKILALLLALVMTLSLTACGSKDDTSSDVAVSGDIVSSESADNETDSESEPESTSKTETESKTESKKETGKNETTKPQNSSSTGNSSGKKPANSTQKPTGNTPSNTQKPSSSTASENETANGTLKIKFVEKKLKYPYILSDGTDLLAKLYGNNTTIQTGDSVVFEIITDEKYTVKVYGGTYTLKGNKLTLTAKGKTKFMDGELGNLYACIQIKGNSKKYYTTKYSVVEEERDISKTSVLIENQLERYAKRKGIKIVNGTDIWGYTWNPKLGRCDENISITHHNFECGDDYIRIVDNPKWIEKAIWLIDEYEKIGIIKMSCNVNFAGGFSVVADTAESAKYWNE